MLGRAIESWLLNQRTGGWKKTTRACITGHVITEFLHFFGTCLIWINQLLSPYPYSQFARLQSFVYLCLCEKSAG